MKTYLNRICDGILQQKLESFGAVHLNKIERLINEYNEKENQIKLRTPDLKLVITGTKYGYQRPDGVIVIPIGCLKD